MEFPAPPYDAGGLSVRFHTPAGEEEESVRVSQTQPRKHSKFTSVSGSESFDFDFTSELFAAPENPEPESPAIYLSAIKKISLKGPTQAKPIRAFNENEFCPMPPTKSSTNLIVSWTDFTPLSRWDYVCNHRVKNLMMKIESGVPSSISYNKVTTKIKKKTHTTS